ncbi:hypothetical protein FRB96_007546 [Tulasnella sp. 330]|nr:hypothetical protein FRB96_007546 [Tulasnella sp. 330]
MCSWRARGRAQGGSNYSNANTSRRPATHQQQLQWLSSPSRSDGPPKAGEASLFNIATQNQYWVFIHDKVDTFVKRFPISTNPRESRTEQEVELGQNIVILFRKLREGVIASKRVDLFTIELYETSACWSILLRDSAQSTSILSQLPELLQKYNRPRPGPQASRPEAQWAWTPSMTVIYFLHLLRTKWPSQVEFLAALSSHPQRRRTASEHPRAILPTTDASPTDDTIHVVRAYLTSLATAIRRTNYFTLATLLDPVNNTFLSSILRSNAGGNGHDIGAKALLMSVNQLREIVRDDIAWRYVHVAYREVSMREEVSRWLAHRLLLVDGDDDDWKGLVGAWMEKHVEKGEVVKKEAGPGHGTSGSWIMRRGAQGPTAVSPPVG